MKSCIRENDLISFHSDRKPSNLHSTWYRVMALDFGRHGITITIKDDDGKDMYCSPFEVMVVKRES